MNGDEDGSEQVTWLSGFSLSFKISSIMKLRYFFPFLVFGFTNADGRVQFENGPICGKNCLLMSYNP